MAPGGNPKGKTGIESVGKDGAANPVGVCREGNFGGTYLGDDGPNPKGEIVILGYWACGGGVEIMRNGSELMSEEGGGSLLFDPWVSRGERAGDRDT